MTARPSDLEGVRERLEIVMTWIIPMYREGAREDVGLLLDVLDAVLEVDDYYKRIELPPAGTPWGRVRAALARLAAEKGGQA